MNYWLFQVNPKIFRLQEVLRAEALTSFAVKTHQKRVSVGDKVIVWQSGKEAGVYALAEVTSAVAHFEMTEEERSYFQVIPEVTKRVHLNIEYNLWNRPITKDLIPNHPIFDDFYAGIPGTNFTATKAQYQFIVDLIQQGDVVAEPFVSYDIRPRINVPLNLILYGPPGTGKTYQTINHALSIIEHRSLDELAIEERVALRDRFDYYLQRGAIRFISFHQSFTYEDFVEGIKPKVVDGQVIYAIEDGVFKSIATEAEEGWEDGQRYVLIVDEINRGNIAGIFGELISLIEDDKRLGAREALQTVLPYSKTNFGVPPNLYIIGTMNTADRSTTTLDIALRRRFIFKTIEPQPALLKSKAMLAGVNLAQLLTTINQRITALIGKDYAIGHAYFYDVRNLDELRSLFALRIIPLLEEYFIGDLKKMRLVLGNTLFQPLPILAAFDTPTFAPPTEQQYELRPIEELVEKDFIRIYDMDYQ